MIRNLIDSDYKPHLHFEQRSHWLVDAAFGTFVSGWLSSSVSLSDDIDDVSDRSNFETSASFTLKPTIKLNSWCNRMRITMKAEKSCNNSIAQIDIYLDINHLKWFDDVFDVHWYRLMMNA